MPIYTKSGDKGTTGLIGGLRLPKSHTRINAIGEIDELNAALGLLAAYSNNSKTSKLIFRIQDELFLAGAELADPKNKFVRKKIEKSHVKFLENAIDRLEKKLPALKKFIRPGGKPFNAYSHLCRAVCRRAERSLVKAHEKEPLNPLLLIYINRLSDLLFMLARTR